MRKEGIPLSFHLDGKKRHIGSPINDVQIEIRQKLGQLYSLMEVLNFYRDFFLARCLNTHPVKRLAKIPGLLEKIVAQRVVLEARIDAHIQQTTERRFVALARVKHVRRALKEPPQHDELVLSMREGNFRISGHEVPIQAGDGEGAAVVTRRQLKSVLKRAEVDVVIDCHRDHWTAWIDGNGPMIFGYGQEGSDES